MQHGFRLVLSHGALALQHNGRLVAPVDQLFNHKVKQRGFTWEWQAGGGPVKQFDRKSWAPQPCYLKAFKVEAAHSVKLWCVDKYARGAQHWFCLDDIWSVDPAWKDVATGQGVQGWLQVLQRAITKLNLSGGLLVKRTMRTDQTEDISRCLPYTCVSSTGLLLLLSLQAVTKAGNADKAARYKQFLSWLLDMCMKGCDFMLDFNSEAGAEYDVTCLAPKAGRTTLPVEGGRVALHEVVDDDTLNQFMLVAGLTRQASGMPLADFLVAVAKHRARMSAFAAQVLCCMGIWLDIMAKPHLIVDPLTAAMGCTQPASTLDTRLADILAMGQLTEGQEDGAVNVEAHVRSAIKLGAVKAFDLQRRQASILTRYWFAGRGHFAKSSKIVMVADASRFQEDTMLGLVGSMATAEGEFLTMVLPPAAMALAERW